MNVLVTGGAGYIGGTVVRQLLTAGHHVVVLDDLGDGKRANVPAAATFVQGSVGDPATVGKLFSAHRFDGVLHFAALIEAGESMVHPERFFANNTAATTTLLDAVIQYKIPRLVFSSTAAVFGNPARVPIEEDDLKAPTNAYGESKLLVERMLPWLSQIHGLRYAVLRYFNVAGALDDYGEAHEPETHLIPLILDVALGKRAHIKIFGTDYDTTDGTCIRDYIHVADIGRAHLLALEALLSPDSKPNERYYNLGNGRGFSVREVIEAARRVTGHPIPIIEEPRRPGDPAQLVASSKTIQRELGWQPQTPAIDDIIASAWRWHQLKFGSKP